MYIHTNMHVHLHNERILVQAQVRAGFRPGPASAKALPGPGLLPGLEIYIYVCYE